MTHKGYPLSVKRNDFRKKRLLVRATLEGVWMYIQMYVRTDIRMDGRTDGRTDVRTYIRTE
jgi:hypothetical protein